MLLYFSLLWLNISKTLILVTSVKFCNLNELYVIRILILLHVFMNVPNLLIIYIIINVTQASI